MLSFFLSTTTGPAVDVPGRGAKGRPRVQRGRRQLRFLLQDGADDDDDDAAPATAAPAGRRENERFQPDRTMSPRGTERQSDGFARRPVRPQCCSIFALNVVTSEFASSDFVFSE